MTEVELLREMYLEDLKKLISFDGGKTHRPRVRRVSNYERIPTIPASSIDHYENIWVWSDTHFGHKNIIKYCDRPFCDLDDMSQQMINNHNDVVGDNDLVIWVGDVAFMGDDRANEILANLKGDRILIIGNHDINKGKVKNLNFKEKHLIYVIDGAPPIVFTHFPFENCPGDWINVHGHIHNSYDTNSLQHINVSVEAIDYRPVHWDDITRMAKTRWDSMDHAN
jgi:calcineurin-like phosphoesterase family protein